MLTRNGPAVVLVPGQDAQTAGSPRRGEWIVLLFGVASLLYVVLGCWTYSAHKPMWVDEFFAWDLLADPSLEHALRAWQNGADSGGPLFYLMGRLLYRVAPTPLSLRLFSAFCLWAAGVLWFRILRRQTGRGAAMLAIAWVWGTNPEFFRHGTDVRFYGLFLLSAAGVVWAADRVTRTAMPAAAVLGLCFLANEALVMSHVTGAVYSGLLLPAVLAIPESRGRRLAIAAGTLLAWAPLLLMREALRNGSLNSPPGAAVGWLDLLRLYRNLPYGPEAVSQHLRMGSSLAVLLLAGVIVLVRRRSRQHGIPWRREGARAVLPLAYLAAPLAFFLLSLAARPVLLDRYLLPYALSFSALLAWLLQWLAESQSAAMNRLLTGVAAVAFVILHVTAVRQVKPDPLPATDVEAALGEPVAVPYLEPFFVLQYYRSSPRTQFYYVGPVGAGDPPSMARSIARSGYWPGHMMQPAAFWAAHPRALLLSRHDPAERSLLPSPHCEQARGQITVEGRPYAVKEITPGACGN